ncbi:MAG: hypothetical protein SVR94_19600, partial [Pseudomonadota bacterium]|nr:hypothetical protein [Pseudomonadota bacterium]
MLNAMHLFLFIALLISNYQFDESHLLDQSKEQAAYYINQVNEDIDQEAYLWALATLNDSNPDVKDYISNSIGETNSLLQAFAGNSQNRSEILSEIVFSSGSKDLLIAFILGESDQEVQKEIKYKFQKKFGPLDT